MHSDKKESVFSCNCLVNTIFTEMLANKLVVSSLSESFPYSLLPSSSGQTFPDQWLGIRKVLCLVPSVVSVD